MGCTNRTRSKMTSYCMSTPHQTIKLIKQLPTSISNRLSNNSSNMQVFNMPKGEYEKALKESG